MNCRLHYSERTKQVAVSEIENRTASYNTIFYAATNNHVSIQATTFLTCVLSIMSIQYYYNNFFFSINHCTVKWYVFFFTMI